MNKPKRTFRQMLDWLCEAEGYEDLWENKDGTRHLNLTQLATRISENTGIRVYPSTLHRAYTGTHDGVGEKTLSTLAIFFGVPTAVIRDEITMQEITEYGMDITFTEVKLLREMRDLTPEGRALVRQTIQTLRNMHAPANDGELEAKTGTSVSPLKPRNTK